MKRSRGISLKRYNGKRARKAAPVRYRRSRRRRYTSGSGTPLTYDNDFKTDYRYKRMPRRKKKGWVKFVKKVRYIANREQGLKKHLFQDVQRLTSTVDKCGFYSASLYTPDAQVNGCHADMGTIFRSILTASVFDNINDVNYSADADKKLIFESAVMDLTWRNDGVSTVIIDLYQFRTRKTFGLAGLDSSNNVHGIYETGMWKQGRVIDEEDGNSLGTGKIVPTEWGTTPFMSSLFCQTFKIVQKKRITIAPGNFVSITLKDPKTRVVNATDCRARICMAGLTHGYFFQYYGVPGQQTLIDRYALDSTLVFTQCKKYNYYLPVSGKDQTAIQPQ